MGLSFTSTSRPPPPPPPPRARSIKDLPTDIMISVLERLSIVDRVRFGSSCSSFHSIFRAAQQLHLSSRRTDPPWMLLPGQSTPAAFAFFSVSDGRIYRIPRKEEEDSSTSAHRSSSSSRRRPLLFLGSSDGWLVTLDQGCSQQLYLLDPITGTKIHLPPLPSSELVPLLESSKAILSCNNSSSSSSSTSPSYTVVLLLARHSSSTWPTALVVCSRGGGVQVAWTPFGSSRREFYSDAAILMSSNTHHHLMIYAMRFNGTLEAWDLSSGGRPSLSTTIVMPKSVSTGFASFTKCLVKDIDGGGGGLLQVWRSREFAKVEFKVFKLETGKEWVEVKSLDGRVLFLSSGCCSSMSMMSRDCPPELQGANNSIYFDCLTTKTTKNSSSSSCIDLGSVNSSKSRESMVFRMEDGSVESLLLLHGSIWEPAPIWMDLNRPVNHHQ